MKLPTQHACLQNYVNCGLSEDEQQGISDPSLSLNWTIKFKRLIRGCGGVKIEGRPHQREDLWPTPFSAPITTRKTRKRAEDEAGHDDDDDKPKRPTDVASTLPWANENRRHL